MTMLLNLKLASTRVVDGFARAYFCTAEMASTKAIWPTWDNVNRAAATTRVRMRVSFANSWISAKTRWDALKSAANRARRPLAQQWIDKLSRARSCALAMNRALALWRMSCDFCDQSLLLRKKKTKINAKLATRKTKTLTRIIKLEKQLTRRWRDNCDEGVLEVTCVLATQVSRCNYDLGVMSKGADERFVTCANCWTGFVIFVYPLVNKFLLLWLLIVLIFLSVWSFVVLFCLSLDLNWCRFEFLMNHDSSSNNLLLQIDWIVFDS